MSDMNSPRLAHWWAGARPHTWANAVAPVVAGSGAAAARGGFDLASALLAAIVAWALIVGVNYANDYSDGIRGTDDERSGPTRLTAGGLAQPNTVKAAAFAAFGIAGTAGITLSINSGHPWLIAVGIGCVIAAWFYTGGKNPYGYRGFGELAVFIFFGLVAVLGTQYTQLGTTTWEGWVCAIGVGCFSSAVNLANNIRDIPTDTTAGKLTLAVRLGDTYARRLWLTLVAAPFILSTSFGPHYPWALLSIIALPFAAAAAMPIVNKATGPALIPVLGLTGRAMLIWSTISALGMAL